MDLKKGLLISSGIAALLVLVVVVTRGQNKSTGKYLDPKDADPELHKKFNFHLIPGGQGNYRSSQFTEKELPYVIKKYNIKRIVRMNGDGRDSRGPNKVETPISLEKGICTKNGCEHYFINAHDGYVKGRGYTKSSQKINEQLAKGNTLIHCAAGMDRTGGHVATYLKQYGIMTDKEQLWKYTTSKNGWENKIKRGTFFGSGFDKYADGFYPIDELKAKYGAR